MLLVSLPVLTMFPPPFSPPPYITVLVGLYEEPERPPNAVDYIKRYMGAPTGVDVDAMRSELESLKQENGQLKQTVADLKEKQDA